MKYLFFSICLITFYIPFLFATEPIRCQGQADGHLQGFDSDGTYIYWSMYSKLIKTDYTGKVINEIAVTPHHGDCCVYNGKIYCATDMRKGEKKGSFVTVYNCSDLSHFKDYPINFGSDDSGGIDGITYLDGNFYIGEGKDPKSDQDFNWIHKFTTDFSFVEKLKIPGKTTYGIQTVTYSNGYFWLGTYSQERTYQCDEMLNIMGYHPIDISVGAFGLPPSSNGETRLMVARNIRLEKDKWIWSADCVPVVFRDGVLQWEE